MRIYQNYHKHDFGSNIRVPDCVCSQEDYAIKAKEYGHGIISSVAHGWQNRYIDTYQLAQKYGLKFVFGTEAYWVKDRKNMEDKTNCHMILIAKNETGRRAINKILSIANIDGFYYQPRIDIELIKSLPNDSVIITTACVAGWKYDDSEKIFTDLHNYFKNNFYLEVQCHHTDKQKEINRRIVRLANSEGIYLIAGVDSHYITEDKAWERDEYLASKGVKYEEEEDWFMDYPDGDTLYERFKEQGILTNAQIEEAINNTNILLTVEDYNCGCFTSDIKMPTIFKALTQEQKDKTFKDLIYKLWDENAVDVPAERHTEYKAEIEKELDTVITTLHTDYFLLNYYMIKKGKEKDGILTNSSRGSGGSFYINKLLGFTTIDRISAQVKMFPERFMSKTRILETKSLADIDFNCSNPEVFAAAQEELLGYNHAKPMIAYGTFKEKNAWRMYARAKNVDNDTAIVVSEQIDGFIKALAFAPEENKDDVKIEDFIEAKYLPLFNDSKSYLGIYSDIKVSPCSYLLYNGEIDEEIGYIRIKSQNGDTHICCIMDKVWADKCKFLKNDLLKVSSIELINRVFDKIGIKIFDATKLLDLCPPEDSCWEVYKNAWTMGINQTEQPNTKRKVAKYRPTNISELCAFVAAVRPGFKSMYDTFESRVPFSYGIPSFDKLIQTPQMPNSFVLYQETSMQALNYADIPMSECYTIIKDISKKNAKEIKSYKSRFIAGFANKIIKNDNQTKALAVESAKKVWQILEDSSAYSFNASHAYAMAIDSLYGAWLKMHYPLDFYTVFLEMCEENGAKDRMVLAKKEAEVAFKIKFPPYKFGQDNTTITNDKKTNSIIMSLSSLKRFNKDTAEALYNSSKNFYPTFVELLLTLLNSKCMFARIPGLIKIGYFDDYGSPKKLQRVFNEFVGGTNRITKTLKPETVDKRLENLISLEDSLPEEVSSFKERIADSIEILGYIQTTFPDLPNHYFYVLEVDTTHAPRIKIYNLKNGNISIAKLYKRQFDKAKIENHSILYIDRAQYKPRISFDNGKFVPSETQKELWIDSYIKIKDFDNIIVDIEGRGIDGK